MESIALAHSNKTEHILRLALNFHTSVETLNVVRVSDLPANEPAKAIICASGLTHTDRVLLLNESDSLKLKERGTLALYENETNIAILRDKYSSDDIVDDILHEITHGNGFMVGQFSHRNPTFYHQTGYNKYFYILENLIGISKVCLQNRIYLNNRQQMSAEMIKDIQEIIKFENDFQQGCHPKLDLSNNPNLDQEKLKNQPAAKEEFLRARAKLQIEHGITVPLRDFIEELESELITTFLKMPKQDLLPFATQVHEASGRQIDPLRFAGIWYQMVLEANGFKNENTAQIEERRKNIRALAIEA